MTKQEVLEHTKRERDAYQRKVCDGRAFYQAMVDYLDVIIECIEKQIPKKPRTNEGKMWICPNCYNNLLWIWKTYPTERTDLNEGLPFCLSCGQAIDWSDNE